MAGVATTSRGFFGSSAARKGSLFLGSNSNGPLRGIALIANNNRSPASYNNHATKSSLGWAPTTSSQQARHHLHRPIIFHFSSASTPIDDSSDISITSPTSSSSPISASVLAENENHGNNRYTSSSNGIRLSKLLSQHAQNLAISRREAERLIRGGDVTIAGNLITSPHYLANFDDLASPGIVQVCGKAVVFPSKFSDQESNSANNSDNNIPTKVWIVHKLKGEVVAEHDPQGRPGMMQRLWQGGVGKYGKKKQQRYHLKPIGRLDIPTEGLILVTNNGKYAREMELPQNELHRTYRVRVHGPLTQYKIKAMQRGMRVADDKDKGYGGSVTRYSPMKVQVEGRQQQQQRSTNCWIRITCTEGKNRQIRNVLKHLGLTVTRLIRVSFGDYQLQTIPPGMALEVPVKEIDKQIHKGPLFPNNTKKRDQQKRQKQEQQEEEAPPVQWVRHYR